MKTVDGRRVWTCRAGGVVLVDGLETSEPVLAPMEQLTCLSAVVGAFASLAMECAGPVPKIDFGEHRCLCVKGCLYLAPSAGIPGASA